MGKPKEKEAHRGVAIAVLACVGLCLFDTGQQFARPILGSLSSRLDVVLLVSQALATIIVLFASKSQDRLQRWRSVRLCVVLAVLCASAQLAMFGGDLWGGAIPAYGGTVLCGIVFGLGFVLWLWLVAGTGTFFSPRHASLGVIGSLAVARAVSVGLRAWFGTDVLFVIGTVCLDVSVAMLLGLLVWTSRTEVERGDPVALRLRDHLPTLLGVGLFSVLFGLTTQIHNNAHGYSSVPDELSALITIVALVVLGLRVGIGKKPLRVDRFFIVTIPLIAAVMALAPLFWSSVSNVADALVKSFFNLYFAALMVYVVQVLGNRPAADGAALRDPMVVPACALAILWSCVALGSIMGLVFMTAIEERTMAVTSAFLAATWICVVAMVIQARVGRSERVVERVVPGPTSVVYVDRANEQIRLLGEQVGLSAREREVCALLVQGRSAARIGEELVLSQNTVKTHLQNIYAKAGVHTKQELLDRLRAIKVE